jgi:chromatin segregation and condensation protein Rec8/ScpA/Scc1 (kleisin family)
MSIMRCTESFVAWTPAGPVSVAKDALLNSDDPLVKGRDRHFVPVEEYVERLGRMQDRSRVTERATAEPDERRTVVPRPETKPETKPEQKPATSTRPATQGRTKKDGEV